MIKLTKFFFKGKGLLVRRSLGEGGRIKDNKGFTQHHFFPKKSGGFTLIEILVVMAIFILIAGFALFVSMDSYRGFSFRSERDTIISVLQKARSQAISNICLGTCSGVNNDGKKHGVSYDSAGKRYIIFQTATNFVSRDSAVDQFIPVNNSVTITLPNIIFNQLDASVSGVPITVTISDTAGHSSQIVINTEGQIDNP